MDGPDRKQTWGMIGLGLLGAAMSRRLMNLGWHVVGYDSSPAAQTDFASRGGESVSSVAEVVRKCDVVSLCLPNGPTVRQVVDAISRDTADRKLRYLLDHSTIEPELSVAISGDMRRHGIEYLEASVCGSSQLAEDGQILILVSGQEPAYQAIRPQLTEAWERVQFVGPSGEASRAKLIFNHVLGLHRAVLAEALGLAATHGMEMSTVLEMLKQASGLLDVASTKGDRMVDHRYEPAAKLSQHRKDVSLILNWAERISARVPLQKRHAELLDEAIAKGWGDADNTVIHRLFVESDADVLGNDSKKKAPKDQK